MRALVCTALGDPTLPLVEGAGSLQLRDVPSPATAALAPHSVLIRVAAAGVNFADVLVVQGCGTSCTLAQNHVIRL